MYIFYVLLLFAANKSIIFSDYRFVKLQKNRIRATTNRNFVLVPIYNVLYNIEYKTVQMTGIVYCIVL